MASIQQSNAYFAFNEYLKKQFDIKTFLLPADINKRHPMTTPTFPSRQRNRVITYHCNGMDIFEEKITDEFSRWTFSFPLSAELGAAWLALNYGSTLAPTGTLVNETQTINGAAATSGTFNLLHNFEGLTGNLDIPFNITAADLKTLLEGDDFPTIQDGDITSLTGSVSTGFVIVFGGRLGNADISSFVIDNTNLVGGALSVTETTKGSGLIHAIARATSPDLPKTSFIIGFEDDTVSAKEHGGLACDAIIIEATNRGQFTCTVELVGRSDTKTVLDYIIPECVIPDPIQTEDSRLRVGGNYIIDVLRSFRFERRNNIPVGNEAFPWSGRNIETVWRNPKPTETMGFTFFANRDHQVYLDADSEVKRPIIADIGSPSGRITINAPNVLLKLGAPDMSFDGELQRSFISVDATPHFSTSINASTNIQANIDLTSQLLIGA